jgi:hypothetical protein
MSYQGSRIHGTENERTIHVPTDIAEHSGSRQLNEEELLNVSRSYLATVPHLGKTANSFLANGADLYKDLNSVWEYATPEDDSYLGTTANEIAGEEIVYEALWAARELGVIGPFSIFNRVVDDNGTTLGYHESYNTIPSVWINSSELALLGLHLATRQIFFGLGYLDMNGDFWMSQKVSGLNRDYDKQTTNRAKPVVNLRDQPLDDSKLSRRIHVTSGDPNRSPWATRVKLGSTSLVIGLLELGEQLRSVRFREELHIVAHKMGTDLKVRNGYPLQLGGTATALEAQQEIIKLVRSQQKSGNMALSEEDGWTLDEWEKAAADMIQNPALLQRRVDWMTKFYRLYNFHEKNGTAWASEEMRQKERFYDYIGPNNVIRYLREKAWQEYMPSKELIELRKKSAPENTRARLRGAFVLACNGDDYARAGWEQLTYMDRPMQINDPRANHNAVVEEFIENYIRKNGLANGAGA